MTINNKSERNYRGKCLGSPVTSYGGGGASCLKIKGELSGASCPDTFELRQTHKHRYAFTRDLERNFPSIS